MDTIYIVVHDDRHTDTEIHAFKKRDDAVRFARQIAIDYCKFEECYNEESYDSYEFFSTYADEGDCVYVVEAEVKQ